MFYFGKVEALVKKECGGMPWEFNLRDVLRWCELMLRHQVSPLPVSVQLQFVYITCNKIA